MIGVLFLTLGALNAALAMTVETCTMGSADSLYGGFLTLLLYLAGAGGLIVSPPRPWGFLALLPAAVIALSHSIFAVRFAWGYWMQDMSACYAMNGGFTTDESGEWMDGGEPLLTCLWLSISAIFWIAAFVGLRGSIKRYVRA